MKNIFFAAIIGFCAAVFSSCQPDLDFTNPPSSPGNDSTYLKMVVLFDTSFPSGLDTQTKYTFQYDAQKRVQLIKVFEYDPGTVGYQYESFERRYYTGNDTLPYKVVLYYDMLTEPVPDTIFLTYQNGLVVRDSTVWRSGIYAGTSVLSFTSIASNRLLTIRRTRYSTGVEEVDSVISVQNRQNGNLVGGIDSVWMANSPGESVLAYQYEFDNHPDPLARLVLPFSYQNYEYQLSPLSLLPVIKNRNNQTKETSVYTINGNTFDYEYGYSYQYRADGYPVVVRDGDLADHFKGIYIYTKL